MFRVRRMDQDIAAFLEGFGLEKLVGSFRENEFDTVRDLLEAEIEASDLVELGVAALKKRKLILKALAVAADATPGAAEPTPEPKPEPEPEPRRAAARRSTAARVALKPSNAVATHARMERLAQPRSPVPPDPAERRRKAHGRTGAAAAAAAAELLHGTVSEQREQQKREAEERLEFQRTLKQVNLLGRAEVDFQQLQRGQVALTSAEEQDRDREQRARCGRLTISPSLSSV